MRAFRPHDPLSCDRPLSLNEHVTWIPQERSSMLSNGTGCNLLKTLSRVECGVRGGQGAYRVKGQACTCVYVSIRANKHCRPTTRATHGGCSILKHHLGELDSVPLHPWQLSPWTPGAVRSRWPRTRTLLVLEGCNPVGFTDLPGREGLHLLSFF